MKFFERIGAFFLSIFMAISAMFGGSGATKKVEALQFAIDGDAYSDAGSETVWVHDPSLFKAEDGTYYIYGSHIASAKSDDLINWKMISSGICDNNKTLVPEGSTLRKELAQAFAWDDAYQSISNPELYEAIKTALEEGEEVDRGNWETNVWASDVFYNKAMGKYCYYASTSAWGTTKSVIWFATSDSPEGTFKFESCIVYSGFNKVSKLGNPRDALNYKFTNISDLIKSRAFSKYKFEKSDHFTKEGEYDFYLGKAPNCIDPHLFYDEDGNLWMVYGSWSGGIYVMPLVEETGLPDYSKIKADKSANVYFGRQIVATNEATDGTGEGSYIVYDKESDYYYLFVTYGGLDAKDGYNMREYRSKNPDGPYVDNMGKKGTDNTNTGLKINGNYKFSTDDVAYLSGGHNSVMIDDDGRVYNCYHVRFNGEYKGYFETTIHQMERTADGWLTMLPFEYSGESAKNLSKSDIVGEYELVDFDSITIHTESDYDAIVTPTQSVSFNQDGTISGFVDYSPTSSDAGVGGIAVNGSWTMENGTYCFTAEFGSVKYSGVAVEATDGRLMLSLTGSDNSTIWAVSK